MQTLHFTYRADDTQVLRKSLNTDPAKRRTPHYVSVPNVGKMTGTLLNSGIHTFLKIYFDEWQLGGMIRIKKPTIGDRIETEGKYYSIGLVQTYKQANSHYYILTLTKRNKTNDSESIENSEQR